MIPNYKHKLEELKAEGIIISKEYSKWGEEQFSHLQRAAPRFWQTVMSHRYILPGKLQSDYINQEACDYLFMDFVVSYSLGLLSMEDEVTHVGYLNAVRALEYERPTYYIERELAEALVRTDVPLDLQMQDIQWIYPQLRIYLPNGLLAITRDGRPNPAMYIDICRGEKDAIYSMPAIYEKELRQTGIKYFPEHNVPMEAFILTTSLHFDCDEGNINYAVTSPWDTTMKNLIEVGNSHDLHSALPSDMLDHQFTSRLSCFAINVMLLLSSLPQEAQLSLKQEARMIRKPRQEGKRTIVGLYAAKVIGAWQWGPKPEKLPSTPTGRHLVPHWRRGHWRKQAYGPKSGLRRFQWIAPYHTT